MKVHHAGQSGCEPHSVCDRSVPMQPHHLILLSHIMEKTKKWINIIKKNIFLFIFTSSLSNNCNTDSKMCIWLVYSVEPLVQRGLLLRAKKACGVFVRVRLHPLRLGTLPWILDIPWGCWRWHTKVQWSPLKCPEQRPTVPADTSSFRWNWTFPQGAMALSLDFH